MTDEIVKSILPQTKSGEHSHPNLIAWKKAIHGYQILLSTRRRIAHHPVAIKIDYADSGSPLNTQAFGTIPIGTGKVAIYIGL